MVRRPTRPARGIRAIAMLVGAAAALAGCVRAPLAPIELSEPPPELTDYYAQKPVWTACESDGLECTTVEVPIDYADPRAGSIELALIRMPTASPDRLGSLLMNPGGPGLSGYDLIAYAVDLVTDDALRDSYDIVGWDPRGVSRSSPISCVTPAELDEYLFGVADNPIGSEAWLDERAADSRAFAEGCDANTGELLGHIDAISNARDLDLMRAALGDQRLNYIGISYGTVFGTEYAELFPDRVGRLVFDGGFDPEMSATEYNAVAMTGFDDAYRAFLKYCNRNDACPLSGSTDDSAAESAELFAGVDARALVAVDGRQLNSPILGIAVARALYDDLDWDLLIQLLGDVKEGDPRLAFKLADEFYGRERVGSYYGNWFEASTAALCLDGEYSDDLAGTRANLSAIESAAPITGIHRAHADWVLVDTICQNWPHQPVITPRAVNAVGAAPILVLGTTNDPATPYATAQALAEQLDSGVLVSLEGEGHTSYARGNACIDATVDAFLVSGIVPDTDPHC